MSEVVKRIYVEKRRVFNIQARELLQDLKENLRIHGLKEVRIVNRYDISGISQEEYNIARNIIFSEPPVDLAYDEELPISPKEKVFAVEYLPGQFDQRADSAAQCIQILTQKHQPLVQTAQLIVLQGEISPDEFTKIKEYCINPVESREASLEKPETLEMETVAPEDVAILEGFISMTAEELFLLLQELGLAMTMEDLFLCRQYFRDVEKRNPTITEIRVLDTYWSDHCRHTTFMASIEEVKIEKGRFSAPIENAYQKYLDSREYLYGQEQNQREICLMDIALIGMKELKKRGKLQDLDESDEINACSIIVPADVDGRREEWLVMFKNETHNHPTEIEPFGGAATCLGGAIRDPLSGRVYVYQAMRVTGSGDPRAAVEDTLPGKLPQRKITTGAASGFSSYGNQIGLATGQVAEVYDPRFIAKRMEIGAVIGAAPRENIVRKKPVEGDLVLLVGGRTGRDGCGGATGSSKEHTVDSLSSCGAEVQKGNPPTERKIQRLFRNPKASTLIKKCNDFGAGGVSVAIGELTDSLEIDLDAVPKKYEGLDGTELAISESQERMAVLIAPEDVDIFCRLAREENLEATVVAKVTSSGRLKMFWRGKTIVDLSRDFLNTSGARQKARVKVVPPAEESCYFEKIPEAVSAKLTDLSKAWLANLGDLNVCSQKGLGERFDSTIGAGSVLTPFGGKYQETPAQGMVAKLPVLNGETTTATAMTYGYNPVLACWSPFHGAMFAVVEAVTKIVALGGEYQTVRLTLQEYFEKLGEEPSRWGKPFSALLGAFYSQKELEIPAIGGKDSMSGTFMDLDVPPTLVAFAVAAMDAEKTVSQEFKKAGSRVVLVQVPRNERDHMPDFTILKKNFDSISQLISKGLVLSSHTIGMGGLAAAISKMAFGNRVGMVFSETLDPKRLFVPDYGSVILEVEKGIDLQEFFSDLHYIILGHTCSSEVITINGVNIDLKEAFDQWIKPLEKVFPNKKNESVEKPPQISYKKRNTIKPRIQAARPRVFIPIFPGTNCEYDTVRVFEKAGAQADTLVINNINPAGVESSIKEMEKYISQAQIIMIPGGFSAGDEPEGSGKFIAAMFRNPRIKEAVTNLLQVRDGLMLGICNGFQALIKLGLLPFGDIGEVTENSPTLTFNTIGRHVSRMVQTKVTSVHSPWFRCMEVGEIHTVSVSHGEGRFVADETQLNDLSKKGQIATQYVDLEGEASSDFNFNPNGSYWAIEGITSPDGRILGKMGHSERIGSLVAINVPGEKDQRLFEAGVKYFK
nr:phosphoribosylformylglycinamidine synthase [Candidatus Contubernalis alkalaceticus]